MSSPYNVEVGDVGVIRRCFIRLTMIQSCARGRTFEFLRYVNFDIRGASESAVPYNLRLVSLGPYLIERNCKFFTAPKPCRCATYSGTVKAALDPL